MSTAPNASKTPAERGECDAALHMVMGVANITTEELRRLAPRRLDRAFLPTDAAAIEEYVTAYRDWRDAFWKSYDLRSK
jgi:hypothetical protein